MVNLSKVSIIVPIFNEESTIEILLEKILRIDLEQIEKEIIVVNDGSTDSTASKLKNFSDKIIIAHHEKNRGKGAALRTAFNLSSGDIILVQDADLEYFPNDYPDLLFPFKNPDTDIVVGIRTLKKIPLKYYCSPYFFGGRILNLIFNLLSPIKISDIHTGYKVIRRNLWIDLDLKEDGFNFCHEFLLKSALKKANIKEIPIQYSPRSRNEGKKIKPADGLIALMTLFKIKLKGI